MRIEELVWDDHNLEKTGRRATQEEIEEAVFDRATLSIRVSGSSDYRRDEEYRRYAFLGLTEAGRFLTVIVDYLGRGQGYPVTVREMDDRERTRYKARGK